jgi:secreted trypsin-like serine protease
MIVATTVLRSLLPFFLGIRSTAAFSSHSLFLLSHRHTAAAAPASFLSPRTLTQHNMSSSASDDVDIAANIAHVRQVIDDAIASSERKSGSVRLVAVSKTKPLELLQAAYEVRRFVS